VPIYLLGSSDFSAQLAAELGLPFAFASHFAPDYMFHALMQYRANFQPSETLSQPHVMVGVNVFAADTDEEAARLFTSLQQQFVAMLRGTRGNVPPPVESMANLWTPPERDHVQRMLRVSAVGSPGRVRATLEALLEETRADELVITAQMYDHAARVKSFRLAAEVMREINAARKEKTAAA
jgi:luciferase family oxidoreductase group 1